VPRLKVKTVGPKTTRTLAVDIGGTGIKTIVLDTDGKPLTERLRVKTPKHASPAHVMKVIGDLAGKQGEFDRVSVGFPGVVRGGVTETAPNLHGSWKNFPLAQRLAKQLGKPVRVAHDATVQGLQVISGQGVELVITLGTGLGSALFLDGKPLPNLEMAHHPFQGRKTYEERLGLRALEKERSKKWNKYLRSALEQLERLFLYDKMWIGGGNAGKIKGQLPKNVRIVSNEAGLCGGIFLWEDRKPSSTR
jgi:polyphosphate glucokinase